MSHVDSEFNKTHTRKLLPIKRTSFNSTNISIPKTQTSKWKLKKELTYLALRETKLSGQGTRKHL